MSLVKPLSAASWSAGSLTHCQFPRLAKPGACSRMRATAVSRICSWRARAARSLLKSRDIHSQIFILFLE